MFKAIAKDKLKQCNFETRWCGAVDEAKEKINALIPKNKNDRYFIEIISK